MNEETIQYQITKCTRCGKEFKDFKISVVLNINTYRLKETGIWESIPNLEQTSQDVLCRDCFDSFANILEKMNEPQTKDEAINMKCRAEHPLDGIEPCLVNKQEGIDSNLSDPCSNTNLQENDIINLVKIDEDVKYK